MSDYNNAAPLKPVSERDSLHKALTKIKARRQGRLPSLVTAWPKFNDAFCDGLEWKTITVIGARPGTGKTLFMEQLISDIMVHNPNEDFRVLKFQMEMVDETNGIRKFSLKTGSDYNTLMSKGGDLVDKEIWNKCVQYYNSTQTKDIVNVVYDQCTISEFEATIAYEQERYKKDGVYPNMLISVDHSALFAVDKYEKDKFAMLGHLGEALTRLKKKYPIAFVVLSQLNRNIEDPRRAEDGNYGNYILDSDIYGSDSLVQHADVIIGMDKPSNRKIRLYGPDKYIIEDPETLVFHFLKSRNGVTKISFFKLDRKTIRISEMKVPAQATKISIK